MENELMSPPPGFATGCLPRSDKCGATFPVFETQVDVIPKSRWPELIKEHRSLQRHNGPIKNQGQEGACAADASVQAFETIFRIQFPRQGIVFSAMSLYKRTGSSAASGSNIGDNLQEMASRGILPENTPENVKRFKHTHPPRGFNLSLPSGWQDTAKIFRVTEWYDIQSWEGFVTALLYGFPITYGRAMHAICAVGFKIDSSGKIWIKYANSWDVNWGENGYGWDSEKVIPSGIDAYGAFAPRVGTIPSSTIISLPPKAIVE